MIGKKPIYIVATLILVAIAAMSFAAAAFYIYSNGSVGQSVTVNYNLSPLQVSQNNANDVCQYTLTTTLTNNGAPMAGQSVTFTWYNSTSDTWQPIAYAITTASGLATTVWYATSDGVYNFNAYYYVS